MMKKSLVLVSLLFLAALSIARAESPNFSTDQVNKQDSFLVALLAQPDRDNKVADLLIGSSKPLLIAENCGQSCTKHSDCPSGCSCCDFSKKSCGSACPTVPQ